MFVIRKPVLEARVIIDCVPLLFCGFVPGMHVCAPMIILLLVI